MSLVESGNSSVLSGSAEADDQRISVFQEYANGGLSILQDFFSDRSIDLDGLLAFIDIQSKGEIGEPDLELTI